MKSYPLKKVVIAALVIAALSLFVILQSHSRVKEGGLWQTTTDAKTGATFEYPDHFLTEYIHAVDWPPSVQVLKEPFICTEGGLQTARAGATVKRVIDGHMYCVTEESEGAAGSIYTNYAYAFPKGNETVILTFSLRFVQCANYDNPDRTSCENERYAFNPDSTIDRIGRSLRLP